MTKICSKCGVEKDIEEFTKNIKCVGGRTNVCKHCVNARQTEWRNSNPERARSYGKTPEAVANKKQYYVENKPRLSANAKERYASNREATLQKVKVYATNNSDKISEYFRQYYIDNRVSLRKHQSDYKKKNRHLYNEAQQKNRDEKPEFRIEYNLRNRMRGALKNASARKRGHFWEIMGCTGKELKVYIESLFSDGMSWNEYKMGNIHLDHIKPCASFDLTNELQQRICFNYRNIRPLWAEDNLTKGSTWTEADEAGWLKVMQPFIDSLGN